MATRYGLDADGDVEMTVPQPVYEFIAAPRLVRWDQASIIEWSRLWQQYVSKMQHRCSVTGESFAHVSATVKDSIEPDVLDTIAIYVLKKDATMITDAELTALITTRCGTLMNGFIPDLSALFKSQLRMDMTIADCEARVFKYFKDFNYVISTNGLQSLIGRGSPTDSGYRDRMKTRCSLLMANIQPAVLKTQIERLVSLENRACKADDVALYDLIVKHAKLQQQYHAQVQEQRAGEAGSRAQAARGGQKGGTLKSSDVKVAKTGQQLPRDQQPPKQQRQQQAPRDGCLVCRGTHWLKDCPTATPEQREAALKQFRERRGSRQGEIQAKAVRLSCGDKTVRINGMVEISYVADTGADRSVLPSSVAAALQLLDNTVQLTKLSKPVKVIMADGSHQLCSDETTVNLELVTAAGPVRLREVSCLVMDSVSEDFLLGNDAIKGLGIDVDRLLEQLAGRPTLLDEIEEFPVGDTLSGILPNQCNDPDLTRLLGSARDAGFPPELLPELEALVMRFKDVWRATLHDDPPARLEPMKVQLREGATPVKCKARKYAPLKSEFMRSYTEELERNGLIRKNNLSRWASPALPVRKPGSAGDFRITIDYRAVNDMTVPIVGAMPNLNVVSTHVSGSWAFAKFDLMKGFWQLPLDEASQEILSFMTEDTVYTPLRVPQGAMDSAIHFQNQMQAALEPMLYKNCLVWIDDVIVYADSPQTFLQALVQFFDIIEAHKLKLSLAKSSLFQFEVCWCGKLVSGGGVRHDPSRVAALSSLPVPATVGDLQYFVFAVNWLHESLIDLSRTMAPLLSKLEAERKRLGRSARNASNVAISWTEEEVACFTQVINLVRDSALLHFPKPDSELCLFTDASQTGWSIIVTQVDRWDPALPVEKQAHSLIICKGGTFKGSSLHWPIIEKEAYPIVKASSELEYLLLRPKGFRMYCDHSNLIYVFAPNAQLKVHVRDRLQRWAMRLSGLRYTIEHIAGSANVWADIVSRWHQPSVSVAAARTRSHVPLSPLRPLDDSQFTWPSISTIKLAQNEARHSLTALDVAYEEEEGVVTIDGKAWIPHDSTELITRLFVIAHCGSQGHRSADAMFGKLREKFFITGLRSLIDRFVQKCLICKHVKGSKIIQRPWGPTFKATRRNEAVHWDYLFLGDARFGMTKYVLVMKDDLSHYCELFPCSSADAESAADGLIQWYKRYGCPEMLFSDQGTHFKNAVISQLSSRLKIEVKFSPVYSPWLNGTVERLNKDILQVLRALLIEYRLDYREWPYLLPMIQANLNHTATQTLGGHAPIEVFLALPPPSPLDAVFEAKTKHNKMVRIDTANVTQQLEAVRSSLKELHKEIADAKERRRLHEKAKKKGLICNYDVGDYVLWSRVDQRLANNKLLAQWVGPFRVIEARPHTFVVRHLTTGVEHEVHPTRLKFYADASFNATEEIKEFVSEQGLILDVKKLKHHRFNERLQRWEMLVAWAGLEDIEDSWESVDELVTSVPQIVNSYIAKSNDAALRTAFCL